MVCVCLQATPLGDTVGETNNLQARLNYMNYGEGTNGLSSLSMS